MSILFEKHSDYPESILIRRFQNEVKVSEIINSWNKLIISNKITPNLKGVINDLNCCSLQMNMDSFNKLITFLLNNEVFHRIKLAVISNSPKNIVFPMMAELKASKLNIRTFSTIKAATLWIMK